MHPQRSSKTSKSFAAVMTVSVILIMLTPLRRGTVDVHPRQAGWLPALNLGGMRDTAAFQRRAISASSFAASEEPLSRPVTASPKANTP
jgi:hypothetical protein